MLARLIGVAPDCAIDSAYTALKLCATVVESANDVAGLIIENEAVWVIDIPHDEHGTPDYDGLGRYLLDGDDEEADAAGGYAQYAIDIIADNAHDEHTVVIVDDTADIWCYGTDAIGAAIDYYTVNR